MKNFQKKFFARLADLENELTLNAKEEYCNIFILGLPRSGTTLLSQIIYAGTNCLCVNNLMARFTDAPLVGAMVSKLSITKNINLNFQSNLGKTIALDEPHEFSWFWQNILGWSVKENGELIKNKKVNWDLLSSKILNLNRILEAPLVWKPLELITDDIENISNIFKKSLFIFIDRDSGEIGNSILQIRNNQKNKNDFWGPIPRNTSFEKLINQELHNQIVDQIFYLRKYYKEVANQIPENRLLKVRYKDLCLDPNKFIDDLMGFVSLNNSNLKKILILNKLKSFDKEKIIINPEIKKRIIEKGIEGYLF